MSLYHILENQLKKEPNYVTDNGELKKWVVINRAQNYDAELIELLLEDEALKAKYFLNIKGVLVFNQSGFIAFLEQKNYLNDSYTAYKNKVGLNIDGKYLKQRNEVTLVWPFKDCILEGGQSREEDKTFYQSSSCPHSGIKKDALKQIRSQAEKLSCFKPEILNFKIFLLPSHPIYKTLKLTYAD